MSEIIFEVRKDEGEGGYIASALGNGIHTQATTVDCGGASRRSALTQQAPLRNWPRLAIQPAKVSRLLVDTGDGPGRGASFSRAPILQIYRR